MKKNNLTIKYSIGLLVITFIVLLVERIIFLLFNKINFNTFRCLLFLSPIVIPLVGLYILQKIILKKERTNINVQNLLTKIFIISFIYMLLSALYIVCRLHILINIKDGMIIIGTRMEMLPASPSIMEKMGESSIQLALINNAKYVMNAIILSTLYISFLVFTFVRHWINNIIQIEEVARKRVLKNYILPIIIVTIILIIEFSVSISLKICTDEFETNIVVKVERGISNIEKKRIEGQLNQIEEIIRYSYKSSDDALNNMKEHFKNSNILSEFDSNIFPATYEITVRSKDKDTVNKKLQMVDGIELY